MKRLMLCLSLLTTSGCSLLPETTVVKHEVMLCPVMPAELFCASTAQAVQSRCYEAEKEINAAARRQCEEAFIE